MVAPAIAAFLSNPKTMAAFSKGMEGAKAIADKSEQMLGLAEAVNIFTQSFAPIAEPLKIVAAQMASGTITPVMGLYKELMELMENPAMVRLAEKSLQLVTFLVNSASTLVDFFDKVVAFFDKGGEFSQWFQQNFQPMIDSTFTLLQQIGGFMDRTFTPIIQGIYNTITGIGNYLVVTFTPQMNALNDVFTAIYTTIWTYLKPVLEWFNTQLNNIESVFESITGIDISGWFQSIQQTITGWFQ